MGRQADLQGPGIQPSKILKRKRIEATAGELNNFIQIGSMGTGQRAVFGESDIATISGTDHFWGVATNWDRAPTVTKSIRLADIQCSIRATYLFPWKLTGSGLAEEIVRALPPHFHLLPRTREEPRSH